MKRITFRVADVDVVGDLHLPAGAPRGAVVVTGPLTSVKEQASGTYAAALAERGFAALAFDHRHFGESGGEPRQLVDPERQIADIRAAASTLSDQLPDLPLFGLGVCFGAGPMAVAVSRDERFRALAGVAGVYTDHAQSVADMGAAYDAVVERGRLAEKAWVGAGVSETIPAVSEEGGDVAMPLREAYEFYGMPRGAVPSYVNGFAVASYAYLLPFDAQGAAELLDVPVVVVHSERALAPHLARRFLGRLRSPADELWLESVGQIDFYDDPRLIEQAADRVAATFTGALTLRRVG